MRKNCERALTGFLLGLKTGKPGESIWTDGLSIFSYETCLVTRKGPLPRSGVIVNMTKYSSTTSRHQHALLDALRNFAWCSTLRPVAIVYNVRRSVSDVGVLAKHLSDGKLIRYADDDRAAEDAA